MPLGLLIQGFRRRPPERILPAPKPLRQRYDAVIIGGGGHGLATAYYLAKDHGIRNVAVLEKGYLAGGNTARNTAIVRSNYLTVEGVAFYAESVSLFANLSHELDFNVMYSERGHLTLAHTDAAVRTARWRAEVNKHLGVNSELIGPQEIARLCPQLNLSKHVRYPVLAALYHPPGAIVRHDAVAWGYAAAAARLGVDIHVGTEVTGIVTDGNRAIGVETGRGTVHAGSILQAVAGSSSRVAALAGLRLPIESHVLQAFVSEGIKPAVDCVVTFGAGHFYISQSDKGGLVFGGDIDGYNSYAWRGNLPVVEDVMEGGMAIWPGLGRIRMLRQWGGLMDMSMDGSPIIDRTAVDGLYLNCGWCYGGFKATPASGWCFAHLIARDAPHEVAAALRLDRYATGALIDEKGAGAQPNLH
jgi:methylglutamate dehydrogenase subunit A